MCVCVCNKRYIACMCHPCIIKRSCVCQQAHVCMRGRDMCFVHCVCVHVQVFMCIVCTLLLYIKLVHVRWFFVCNGAINNCLL